MKATNYLTDEEIMDVLRRIGIRQKPELDIAISEYKEYWQTVYLAILEGNNYKDSSILKTGQRD